MTLVPGHTLPALKNRPTLQKKLQERAVFLQAVRSFFNSHGYLEVETPIRQPVLIPEAQIIPFSCHNWFLQSSPELCMKRLLAHGHGQIFQICKCFRAQERGRLHLSEFTMLEWYRLHDDYEGLMAETEMLGREIAHNLAALPGFDAEVCALLTESSWQRLTVADAFDAYAGLSAVEALAMDCFDEVLVTEVEPHLGNEQPCFLYDYPAQLGSLARLKADYPEVAERFELYIQGIEVANGFSELTDVMEQRQRFSHEIAQNEDGSGGMPEKFLADLEQLSPACGIALGLDRLLMLLCGAGSIDEVVAFTSEEL